MGSRRDSRERAALTRRLWRSGRCNHRPYSFSSNSTKAMDLDGFSADDLIAGGVAIFLMATYGEGAALLRF